MRALAARIPDALPALAVGAAVLARVAPSAAVAARVDVLLAALVFVTALDIDPRRLLAVHARWRLVLLLAVVPLLALTLAAWGLSQLTHGAERTGILSLGLAPAEVASVGLIGLSGGPAEIALAVLAGSLAVSALIGPPLLALLAGGAHHADTLALLGRFSLVVIVPLIAGLAVRGTRPGLARAEEALAAMSSLLVVALVYASLSDTRGDGLAGAAAIGALFLVISAAAALVATRALPSSERDLGLTIGMRDFAVAAALASAAAGAHAAHVAGVYGVMMLIAGAAVAGITRAHARPRVPVG